MLEAVQHIMPLINFVLLLVLLTLVTHGSRRR